MKKLFALLAVVLAVVSCQKDADLDVNVGGEQLVNITVGLPEATRATSADSGWDNTGKNLRVIFQVFDEKGNTNNDLRQVKTLAHTDSAVNFDVRLVPGRDYTFVAWADQGEGYFNVDDLTKVTFVKDSWRAMDEVRDAYTATELIPAGQSIPNVTLTLTRPFAKVRVVTTDMDAIKDLKLDVNNAVVEYGVALPNAFNAFSGKVVERALQNNVKHTYKYSYDYVYKYDENENENEKTLFADYILVPANDVVKFNLKVYDAEKLIRENSFTTDIPVERNKLTTIKGNILTDGSGIKVEVKDEFEQPGNEIEVVEVATADALIAALNTPNAEVVLTTDITLDQPLSITSNATIDGNGNAFIYTGNGDRVIDIRDIATRAANNGTVVTIKNLSIDLGNKSYERGINYNSNGKLILDNVKVVGTNVTYALNLPGLSDNCEVEINNCEFKGIIALNVWGENAVINVNNSILTSVDNSTAEDYAAINLNKDAEGTVVNVNGGKIIAKNENGEPSAASNNATDSGKINISETTEVIGYKLFPVATVTYTTTDDYYTCTTLQDAIDKAAETPSTATVTLIKDIESSEIITVSGKATINGNGHTITSTAGRAINVSGATDVTIKNLNIVASGERAINVIQNSQKVTIENVTATAANYTVNVAGSAPNATVVINNSDLTGLNTVNIGAANTTVEITNTKITTDDKNDGESYDAISINKDGTNSHVTVNGGEIVLNGDSVAAAVSSDYSVVTFNDTKGASTDDVVYNNFVIVYGDYAYTFTSFNAALDKAIEDKKEVTVVRSFSVSEPLVIEEGKIATINLNGKTITGAFVKDGGALIENNGTLKIVGGTLKNTYTNGDAVINNSGELVLQGIEIKGAPIADGSYPAYAVISSGKMIINDGTEVSADRGCLKLSNGGETVINGGTFVNNDIGSSSLTSHVVDVEDGGSNKLTINGGTFEHRHATTSGGVVICNRTTGTVYVNGGNFSGGNYYGNDNLSDYGYGGTFSVTGGTYTAEPATNYIADGYKSVQSGDKYMVVKEDVGGVATDNATLDTAIQNAQNGDTIALSTGDYDATQMTNIAGKTISFVGNGEDTVFDYSSQGYNTYVSGGNGNFTFENMTINRSTENFAGMAHTNSTVYKNCVINGVYFVYEKSAQFIDCTFNITGNNYNCWLYGTSKATYTNCTFNCDGKSIYVDGNGDTGSDAEFNNCVFNDINKVVTDKAAVETGTTYGKRYELIFNNTTVNGFNINPNGFVTGTTLWANKNSMPAERLIVTVDGYTWVADGLSQKDGEYYVSNANGLNYFSNVTAANGTVIKLAADIDMNGAEFKAIAAGYDKSLTFDGQNHTIKNVKIATCSHNKVNSAGLFFCYTGGTLNVSNLVVEKATSVGATYAGVITGYTQGNATLTNITVKECNIRGVKKIGGISGFVEASTTNFVAENCKVIDTTVAATEKQAGTIIGYNAKPATLKNCTVENSTATAPQYCDGGVRCTDPAQAELTIE